MTVLVGFTPGAAGKAALFAAIEESLRRKTRLIVLNSSRGDALSDPGLAQSADLEWARTTAEEAGVRCDVVQRLRGRDASEELIELAGESAAAVCVIGIRQRTAVGKMLLGSNAHRVLMDSPCPVLTVRSDEGTGVGSRRRA